MDFAERLRKIMKSRYGITTSEQLMQAIEDQDGLDIGIFCSPPMSENKGEKEIA